MFNNKPTFGTTGGLFGSGNTTAAPTFAGFGQQQQPQQTTSLFGQPAANPGSTTAFGMQPQQPATAAPFGTSSGFGFGSNTSAPTNTSLFGSQPAATSNLFGQQQRPATPFAPFGGGSNTTNTTTGGLFGQPASNTTAFGAQTSGVFGQPGFSNTTTGGLFGNSNTAAQPSAFGTTFGSNLGVPQQQQQQSGTAIARFQHTPGTDQISKNGFPTTVTTHLQAISAMDAYKDKSLEELRFEDYAVNRKGVQAGGGLFGSASKPAAFGSAFGSNTATQPFGSTTTGGLFGQQPQQPATNTFGGFGTTSTANTNTFGGFGTQQPANSSIFGQNQAKPSLFGFGSTATTTTTASQPAFGGFGQQTAAAAPTFNFGGATTNTTGTAAPAFGGFGTQPQTASVFGQKPVGFGAFGTTTNTAQQPTTGFSFGTNTAQQQQPAATTNLFGGFGAAAAAKPTLPTFSFSQPTQQQQQPSLFGQPAVSTATNLFGAPATTSAAPAFNFSFGQQQNKPITQFPSFGTNTTTVASTQPAFSFNFGAQQQPAATQQQPSLFGGFGAATNTNSGLLFGGLATSVQQQPSLFGGLSTQPAQQQQSSGLFSGFGTAASNAFTGLQQQPSMQQQQMTFPVQQPSSSSTSNVIALMKRYPHISNPLVRNVLPLEIESINNAAPKPMQLAKDMVRVMHETYKFDTSGVWPGSPQWGSSSRFSPFGGSGGSGDNSLGLSDEMLNLPSATRYYPPPPVRLESVKRRVFNTSNISNNNSGNKTQNSTQRRTITLTSPNETLRRRSNLITIDPLTMQPANDVMTNSSFNSPASDQRARIDSALNEQVRVRIETITAEMQYNDTHPKQRADGSTTPNRRAQQQSGVSPSTSTPAAAIYPKLQSAFNNNEISVIQKSSPQQQPLLSVRPAVTTEVKVSNKKLYGTAEDAVNETEPTLAVSSSPTVIISTRPDYQVFPKMNFKLDANGRCFVDIFRIQRPGFGSIEWPGRTDVAGLNIDELIQIDRKSVTVYGGETSETKPAVGEGLNKLAMVQFENVRTSEKRQAAMNGIQSRSSPNARKYVNFLRKSVEAMNGTFLEYDWEDDTLTFEVQHFSKYSLPAYRRSQAVVVSSNVQQHGHAKASSTPVFRSVAAATVIAPNNDLAQLQQFVHAIFDAFLHAAKPDKKQNVPILAHFDAEKLCSEILLACENNNKNAGEVPLAVSTVQLCTRLFAPVPVQNRSSAQGSYFSTDPNKKVVQQWLTEQISTETDSLSIMYTNFIVGNIDKAVEILHRMQNNKNFALASIMTLSGNSSGSHVSALLMPALAELRQHRLERAEADPKPYDLYVERILMCMVGDVAAPLNFIDENQPTDDDEAGNKILSIFDGLNWKQSLALIINHLLPLGSSLRDCLLTFERHFAAGNCAAPISDWILASGGGSGGANFDPAYELMCYRAFGGGEEAASYSLANVVEPEKFASSSDRPTPFFSYAAATLPFVLFEIIKTCTMLTNYDDDFSTQINLTTRMELVLAVSIVAKFCQTPNLCDDSGMCWQYALLASLLVNDSTARADLLWQILRSFAVIFTSEHDENEDNAGRFVEAERQKELFALQHLAIPIEFLHRAKAAKALESGKTLLACWFLAHGGYADRARRMLVTRVFDEMFGDDNNEADYSNERRNQMQFLSKLLEKLMPNDDNEEAVDENEQIWLDAIEAMQEGVTLWMLLLKYCQMSNARFVLARTQQRSVWAEMQRHLPLLKELLEIMESAKLKNIPPPNNAEASEQQFTDALRKRLCEKLSRIAENVEAQLKIDELPQLPLTGTPLLVGDTDGMEGADEELAENDDADEPRRSSTPLVFEADDAALANDRDKDAAGFAAEEKTIEEEDAEDDEIPIVQSGSSMLTRFMSKIWK